MTKADPAVPGSVSKIYVYNPNAVMGFINMTNGAATGIYTDQSSGRTAAIKDFRLLDATGAVTPDLYLATTGLVTGHDGRTWTFEVIRVDASAASNARMGRITKIADRNGNAIRMNYLFAANATDASMNNDRTQLWKMTTIVDAYGRTASFAYQATQVVGQWVVSTITLPTGKTLAYRYGNPGLSGQTTQINPAWDIIGLDQVTHPDNSISSITTRLDNTGAGNSQCQVVTFRDLAADSPTGRNEDVYLTLDTYINPTTGVASTQSGRLVRMVTKPRTPTVNEVVYLNTLVVTSGTRNLYVYDGGESMFKFVYNGNGQISKDAHATAWSFATDPATWTFVTDHTYGFDTLVRITAKIDGAGNNYSYTLDSVSGGFTKVTNPDTTFSTTTLNGFRQPLLVTDELGRKTQYTYDAAGNLTKLERALGLLEQSTWNWTYNAKGQVLTAIDARNNVTTYGYDAIGQLVTITEPKDFVTDTTQAVTTFGYDGSGRMTSIKDAANRIVTYGYDDRNRIVTVGYADTSTETVTYATTGIDAGLAIQSKDRNGNLTTYSYDSFGRCTTTTFAATKPESVTKVCSYLDGTTKIASCTDRGETTSFNYDFRLREIARTVRANTSVAGAGTFGGALTTTTTYDPLAMRITSSQDPYGRKTFYVFDKRDRVIRTVRETIAGGVGAATVDLTLARILTDNAPYVIVDATFDGASQITVNTDPRGNTTTYAYDGQGRMTTRVLAANVPSASATTAFSYDAQGNVTKITYPRTLVEPAPEFATVKTYTFRNLLATQTEASGRPEAATVSYTYSPTQKVLTFKDGRLNTRTFTYGTCCDRIATIVDEALKVTSYTYDFNGNLTSVTEPIASGSTKVTSNTYDGLNRIKSTTNGQLETTTYTYDDNMADASGLSATYAAKLTILGLNLGSGADGSAMEIKNHLGQATLQVFDGLGRTVAVIDANNNATCMIYDGRATLAAGTPSFPGELVMTTTKDALGNLAKVYTDGAGRTLASEDADTRLTRLGYDAYSNRTIWRDPNGVGGNCLFDERNNNTQCTDTAGAVTKRSYNLHNSVISRTDALNVTETSAYDGRERKVSNTDRIGAITTFGYDANNNLISIQDGDAKDRGETQETTRYTYDARNLLVEEAFRNDKPTDTYQNGDKRTYAYDDARRLVTRVDQLGQTTTFAYDKADRLLTRTYFDGKVDTFTYDQAGRMLTANTNRYLNTVTYTYDPAGRQLSEKLTMGTDNYLTGYGYDVANRRTDVVYPSGPTGTAGKLAKRSYTNRNQLSKVVYDGIDVVTSRLYDNGRRQTTTTLGNGRIETRGYTINDNLIGSIVTPGVMNLTYTYDANKRKTAENDGLNASENQAFDGYDGADRLTSWKRTTADSQTWALSKVGDWTSTVRNGQTETRTHDPVHELLTITPQGSGAITLTFDLKGNLTRDKTGQTYTWDVENRMATATVSGITTTYAYDALGRRVSKTVGAGVPTRFINSGAQVIQEYAGSATTAIQVYVWGSYVDELLAFIQGSVRRYAHSNNQYSVVATSESTGAASERYRYDAYGTRTVLDPVTLAVRTAGSSVGNQYGYTGRYHDAETGLAYFRTRYYSSQLGRFLNRMPWSSISAALISNYSFSAVDPQTAATFSAILAAGFGNYFQGRYNLYDFASVNPANLTEPYSGTLAAGAGLGLGGAAAGAGIVIGGPVIIVGAAVVGLALAIAYAPEPSGSIGGGAINYPPTATTGPWYPPPDHPFFPGAPGRPAGGGNTNMAGSGGTPSASTPPSSASPPSAPASAPPPKQEPPKGSWDPNKGRDAAKKPPEPDAALDATGKVHGELPKPQDLSKYSREELERLRDELKKSVQRRIEVTCDKGSDPGHGRRQAEEQALIKSIEKQLSN